MRGHRTWNLRAEFQKRSCQVGIPAFHSATCTQATRLTSLPQFTHVGNEGRNSTNRSVVSSKWWMQVRGLEQCLGQSTPWGCCYQRSMWRSGRILLQGPKADSCPLFVSHRPVSHHFTRGISNGPSCKVRTITPSLPAWRHQAGLNKFEDSCNLELSSHLTWP